MEEIVKIAVLAVAVCILSGMMKQNRPEYAPIAEIAAVAAVAAAVINIAEAVLRELSLVAELSQTGDECITLLIKALATAAVSQTASDICRDTGNSALAGVTELVGKFTIILFALPLIKSAVALAAELINI